MNNDLEQFSEERLKDMQKHVAAGMTLGHADALLIRQVIDIALSVKQAKPVAQVYQPANIGICAALGPAIRMINVGLPVGTLLYTTPQPAHTEQDGWIKCSDRMPEHKVNVLAVTACGSIWTAFYNENRKCWDDGDYYDDIKDVTHWMPLPAAPKPDGALISEGTKSDSCQWNRDEDSVYSTGCGNEWQFTDGGLEDNQIKFCPYCSGKIAAPKPESE